MTSAATSPAPAPTAQPHAATAPHAPVGRPYRGTLVVEHVLHEGGVLVFRGRGEDGGAVRCRAPRGAMPAPAPGEAWAVDGAWETHPAHGAQVRVGAAALARPSGPLVVEVIARDAAAFPGIGVVAARRVWDAHGATLFDLLDAGDPAPFVALLGAERSAALVAGWRRVDGRVKGYRWLSAHGFSLRLAARVLAVYGGLPVPAADAPAAERVGPAVWHLTRDPYRMLAFAGWGAADAAARRLGVGDADPRRLAAAAEAACAARLTQGGHTWTGAEALRAGVRRLLGGTEAEAARAVAVAADRGVVAAHAGGYQPPGAFVMERYVQARVRAMRDGTARAAQIRLDAAVDPADARAECAALLDRFDARNQFPLTAEQRAAAWMSVTEPVSLLLGGPGVGKTTVLEAVHVLSERAGRPVHQAALAGRAALRLREATGRDAATIAALLARLDAGAVAVAVADDALVVLDEGSMIDLASLYRLLRRLPPGARLLLCGDPGQLPPVGFGLTLHALAADPAIPRVELTVPQRQTAASGIPRVCEAIRHGRVPELAATDWRGAGAREGVSFVDAAPHAVADVVTDLLGRMGGASAAQIVGSVRRRPGGVDEINRRLQALRAPGRRQLHGRFYAGDPVVVTENDYELGVMNGELGVALADAEHGGLRCAFDGGEKTLPAAAVDALDLAYAITCHKAQGSQFERVIVPVTESRLLDRSLLLTAVSRARRQAVLVGDRAAFRRAVTAPASHTARDVGLGR